MTKTVKDHVYVFCAVRGTMPSRFVARLPTMPDGGAVRTLPLVEGISLIVADVPASTYRSETLDARMSDLDWVARCGTAHHAVADAIAPRHTVVPFRLFTIFSSEARARATLRRAAARMDEALDRVKGKAEWALRVAKPDAALGGASAHPIKSTRASGRASTKAPAVTGTSFLTQKAVVQRAAVDLATRVRQDAAHVFDSLADIADQASERSIGNSPGLLLDAAFLVSARRTTAFKKALEGAAQGLLRNGCRVSLTGPWPPYSFVSLETRTGRG